MFIIKLLFFFTTNTSL